MVDTKNRVYHLFCDFHTFIFEYFASLNCAVDKVVPALNLADANKAD